MSNKYDYQVVRIGNKFVVTKNGQKVSSSQSDTQSLVTEFESKQDAEKYASILKSLCSQKVKN